MGVAEKPNPAIALASGIGKASTTSEEARRPGLVAEAALKQSRASNTRLATKP
jgi:hypothetical protein